MLHNEKISDVHIKAQQIKEALRFLRKEARKYGLHKTENSLSITETIIDKEMTG
ncbi:hypothetical protein [Komagataeibacter sp. FNDCR2]|uniref:hypothetical protein n=1 Tax=Komagataeibacter sp. FNDCR2 TaxID=2878682 RepID=UPI001E56C60D|nr:hypothetical protein [Komagataeibacter sp. FNDCR2]MCE2576695.1 hypothetical protein [Komagataeibacter sp. FNDCR2]